MPATTCKREEMSFWSAADDDDKEEDENNQERMRKRRKLEEDKNWDDQKKEVRLNRLEKRINAHTMKMGGTPCATKERDHAGIKMGSMGSARPSDPRLSSSHQRTVFRRRR